MAYEARGRYEGDLAQLNELVAGFEFRAKPAGYEATNATQEAGLMAALLPLLGDVLPGRWTGVMVTTVLPGGFLPLHRDGAKPGTRFHLVIETNAASWCLHGGEWQHLEAGGIYTIEPTIAHGAVNWGDTPRTHLIFDVSEG